MTSGADDIRAAFDAAEDVDLPEDLTGGPIPPQDAAAPGGMSDDAPEAQGALLPLNDTGNGARFALYCGQEAMYVPRVGWFVWDGMRWKLDPDAIEVRRLGQTIHERIQAEIPHLRLTSAEQRRVTRLDAIFAELRAIGAGDTDLSEEDASKRKAELADERDRLNGQLWGKGSTRQRHLGFGQSTGNKGKIDALIGESVTHLARAVEDLDSDPLTINTRAGLLRFAVDDMRADGAGKVARVTLEPHARETPVTGRNSTQFVTKLIPVDYDPDATCPAFDRFLQRIVPEASDRAFLQRWFGLSMTALPVQKFLYLYGMGANGKSLLTNLMRKMLGDYATMVPIESLTGQNRKSGSDATPDLMKLIGARAALTTEPGEGERMQEDKIKRLTGGDSMLVRALHTDFVEFTPYFKLTFTANHKLEIRGTDDGIWRRPLLMLFNVQIPEAERDEALGDRLFETERAGILNWMVAGLLDFLESGLQEPASVREATEEYRRDSDPIGDFLASWCVMEGGSDWTAARDVIDACYLYQLENSGDAWQPGTLSRRIKDRAGKYNHPKSGKGFNRAKRSVWGYAGLRLTDEVRRKLDTGPRDSKGLPALPREESTSGGYASGEINSDADMM